MDEVVVLGDVGERVDALLGHLAPLRVAELGARERGQAGEVGDHSLGRGFVCGVHVCLHVRHGRWAVGSLTYQVSECSCRGVGAGVAGGRRTALSSPLAFARCAWRVWRYLRSRSSIASVAAAATWTGPATLTPVRRRATPGRLPVQLPLDTQRARGDPLARRRAELLGRRRRAGDARLGVAALRRRAEPAARRSSPATASSARWRPRRRPPARSSPSPATPGPRRAACRGRCSARASRAARCTH